MILYVNGDSHSLGHGTGSMFGMTTDDPLLNDIDEAPHPYNLKNSYGYFLAKRNNWNLVCQARSGGSLDRAIRTTQQFVYQNIGPIFVLIGIPSLEREEWLHNGVWYQVNGSGHEGLPTELQSKYKEWVSGLKDYDYYERQISAHEKVKDFHLWLNDRKIEHLFFNTAQSFLPGPGRFDHYDWQGKFFEPYSLLQRKQRSFLQWCHHNHFKHIDKWGHYGTDAHKAWSEHIEPWILGQFE